MKIWISKNSEIPVHEQLVAQIILGIAAGDFKVGEKIHSTRELARRCGLHFNTVSSAYKKLVDQHVLEFRKGSGFYVAEAAGDRIQGVRELDRLIAELFESAKAIGFEREEVVRRIGDAPLVFRSDRVVVVESDAGLREILVHELSLRFSATTGISFEDFSSGSLTENVTLAAMLDEKPKIEPLLSDGRPCFYMKGQSVAAAMSGRDRPSPDETVAVVSGWEGFLTFARIILLAAKIDPGNLIVRSTADVGWLDAIRNASIVICDTLTAHALGSSDRVRRFQVISDESLDELEQVVRG